MPLDTRIALGVQPLKLENPMNQLAQFLQVQGAQRQNQLGEMQMRQAEKAERDAEAERVNMNALNALYPKYMRPDGSLDEAGLLRGVADLGQGSRIPALQDQFTKIAKARADVDKVRSDVDKNRFETAEKGYNAFRNVMGSLRGVPGVTAEIVNAQIMGLVKAGLLPPERGQEFVSQTPTDPAELAAAIDKASRQELTPEQRFTVFAPKPTQVDDGQTLAFRDTNPNSPTFGQTTAGGVTQKQVTPGDKLSSEDRARALAQQAREAAAGRAVTMRGQNMTDARARESNAASLSKPFEVTGPEGTPILVQQAKDGSIRPVAGFSPKGGADKPLTDAQSKALLFGARMKAAEQVLESMLEKGVDRPSRIKQAAEGLPLVGQSAAEFANAAIASPEQQQVGQAQRDFINAVLRRESGAVIADSEFDNARKQYFPQIGDDAATKAQKKRNREIAQRGILAEVPRAAVGRIDEVVQGTPPNTPRRQSGKIDLGGGFTLN